MSHVFQHVRFAVTRVLQGLVAQERRAVWKLRDAFKIAKNRRSITLRDRHVISPSRADELSAANPFARIRLGSALWSDFSEFFDLSEDQPIPEVPMYWLSVADVGCMTAFDATSINAAAFQRHLRVGLEGLSYLGMMDPGLYANIQPGTNFSEKTGVNWHLHLFAWGEEPRAMKHRVKRMNKLLDNYRPIVPRPEGEGFHRKLVTEVNIAIRFRYMCKTPRKAYRIGKKVQVTSDGGTEVSFVSSKGRLRPGQHITLFHLLKSLSLEEILFAGGDGVDIRRRALRRI